MSDKPIDYLQIAAQCWCDKRVSDRVMDISLAEVFADKMVSLIGPLETARDRLKEKHQHASEANHQAWNRVREQNAEIDRLKAEVERLRGTYVCSA